MRTDELLERWAWGELAPVEAAELIERLAADRLRLLRQVEQVRRLVKATPPRLNLRKSEIRKAVGL